MLAVAVEKLLRNPCDRVDPPRVPRRDMVFLDWDQAVRLAEAHSERFRALIYLAVDSGMRWGELIGLRRASVDLTRRKVRVTEQLTQLADHSWIRQQPKTSAGVRSITISAVTADVLRDHLERFAQPGSAGLVFCNGAGNPISSSSFRGQHFGRALRATALSCRIHGPALHERGAGGFSEGAHSKAIQVRMGHASITVTLDRYGHLYPELDEAIADGFSRKLADARRRLESTVVHLAF